MPGAAPRLSFDSLFLYLSAQQLVIIPEVPEKSHLPAMERVATKILDELPHTPMTGIGVNFQFLDENPDSDVLKVFGLADMNRLADAGFSTKTTSITRALKADDLDVNFTLAFDASDHVAFEFNYHSEASSAGVAAEKLRNGIEPRFANAMKLLKGAYALNLEGIPT